MFKKHPCPEITLIVPALYILRMLTIEEEKEFRLKGTNYFVELEKMAAPVINLKFIPVRNFSLIIE
jgi:hypothetical protein